MYSSIYAVYSYARSFINSLLDSPDVYGQVQVDRDGTILDGDDSDSDMECDDDDEMGEAPMAETMEPKAGPVIDEDGFELVQNNRRRGRG
eukprot:scaffold441770_cov46-Prasinocladus_malaysianus.AAC.2